MASEVDLAYTAGLIDGEGCIGVYPQKCKTNKAGRRYSLTVVVSMSNWEAPLWLKETFGGYYQVFKNKGYGTRIMYAWRISGKPANRVLKGILPYLRIKYRQAEMAIEFQDKMKMGKHESAIVIEAQKILSDAIKAEKRR